MTRYAFVILLVLALAAVGVRADPAGVPMQPEPTPTLDYATVEAERATATVIAGAMWSNRALAVRCFERIATMEAEPCAWRIKSRAHLPLVIYRY